MNDDLIAQAREVVAGKQAVPNVACCPKWAEALLAEHDARMQAERERDEWKARFDSAWADMRRAVAAGPEARVATLEAERDALVAWVGQIGYPYDFTTTPPLPERFVRLLAEWWWRDSGEDGTVEEWEDGIADEAQIATRAALGEQDTATCPTCGVSRPIDPGVPERRGTPPPCRDPWHAAPPVEGNP